MNADHNQQIFEPVVMQMRQMPAILEGHIAGKRTRIKSVHIHRKEPQHDHGQNRAEHQEHTDGAYRVVAITVGGITMVESPRIIQDAHRSAHEMREAGGGRAEKAPVKAHQHNPEDRISAI